MSESQKETFRKYLEQAGAIDVLVKGKQHALGAAGEARSLGCYLPSYRFALPLLCSACTTL